MGCTVREASQVLEHILKRSTGTVACVSYRTSHRPSLGHVYLGLTAVRLSLLSIAIITEIRQFKDTL